MTGWHRGALKASLLSYQKLLSDSKELPQAPRCPSQTCTRSPLLKRFPLSAAAYNKKEGREEEQQLLPSSLALWGPI